MSKPRFDSFIHPFICSPFSQSVLLTTWVFSAAAENSNGLEEVVFRSEAGSCPLRAGVIASVTEKEEYVACASGYRLWYFGEGFPTWGLTFSVRRRCGRLRKYESVCWKLPRRALLNSQAISEDHLRSVVTDVKQSVDQRFSNCWPVSVEKEVGGWFQCLLVLPDKGDKGIRGD